MTEFTYMDNANRLIHALVCKDTTRKVFLLIILAEKGSLYRDKLPAGRLAHDMVKEI
jgi:hypothetical protein